MIFNPSKWVATATKSPFKQVIYCTNYSCQVPADIPVGPRFFSSWLRHPFVPKKAAKMFGNLLGPKRPHEAQFFGFFVWTLETFDDLSCKCGSMVFFG